VTGKRLEMELLIVLGAFVVIDVLAIRYGTDSRPMNVDREDRSAVRSGN
jgi:hypothetical protein